MINAVTMDSRITLPVKYGATQNGTPMSKVAVANNRGKQTNYFDCVAFGKTADYLKNYAHVGQKMMFRGCINHGQLTTGKPYLSITLYEVDLNRDDGSKFTGKPATVTTDNYGSNAGKSNHIQPAKHPDGSSSDVKGIVNHALSRFPNNR